MSELIAEENPELSGNVPALLAEIRQALEKLMTDGGTSQIDLNTLPLTSADQALLFDSLGQGEVSIRLDVMGESTIQETALSGVWLVEHKQPDGELLTRHLEICRIPAIVPAQEEDIAAGLAHLDELREKVAG